ncbi:hypothetical protein PPERSA_09988 [Pseudocohnilembus persalinus]|uniref:Dipeptidase E n=1 Tax=Pseudocohnilembus persalinus TaxID=266149 RepID=A0A0V0QJ83_PSEPJ|nr:hypothetical protein PPERSA_09988 [Pseudocohnilembus persalinus]|eukprot:KRX02371.1 hypothetical protein PPERSA_09988 [Pseudocohnilembus persalinus]
MSQGVKRMFLISSSKVHGCKPLEFIKPQLVEALEGKPYLLFIPFARAGGLTHDQYTDKVRGFLQDLDINITVKGIHEFDDMKQALKEAKILFTGGGNTFLLLNQLYKYDLIQTIQDVVNSGSCFYMGASAGSNITGISVQNTNDMPIIHPPSFESLNLVNFNINPHYIDADPNSKHKGETREDRINEFHVLNSIPVFGIREGAWLEVVGDKITLRGEYKGRLFQQGKEPQEIETGSDVSFINKIVENVTVSAKLANAQKHMIQN